MEYTKEYMQKMFNYINEELFDTDLPDIFLYTLDDGFIEKSAKDWNLPEYYGICCPSGEEYFIGISNSLTRTEFFDTLVHELIHVYCMENYRGYSGHGGYFRLWTRKAVDTFYYKML